MNRKVVIAMIVALASSSAWSASERLVSKFTSTARETSIYFKEDEGEGGTGFEGLFAGLGGYQLLHLMGDERSWINIRFSGKTVDLYSATMARGPGTFPHKANDLVEWRGVEKDGRFTPYAIIYRLGGYDEERQRTNTRLIIIKLEKERSRIIGCAEGANEDAQAKHIADKARPRGAAK